MSSELIQIDSCVYVYLCNYILHVWGYLLVPEEMIRSFGAGVTSGYEPSYVGAWN